jgi:hypothetical protein
VEGAISDFGRSSRFTPLTCSYTVELRGLEPLTPTLPGAGRGRDHTGWVTSVAFAAAPLHEKVLMATSGADGVVVSVEDEETRGRKRPDSIPNACHR